MFNHISEEISGYRFKTGLFGKQILQVQVKLQTYCILSLTRGPDRYKYRNATKEEIGIVSATKNKKVPLSATVD